MQRSVSPVNPWSSKPAPCVQIAHVALKAQLVQPGRTTGLHPVCQRFKSFIVHHAVEADWIKALHL